MSDWFSVDRIDGQTFAISEWGQWQHVHDYLLVGKEAAALIDSGTGVGDIGHLVRGITSLDVIALTTHAHWDHMGGHSHFKRVGVHPKDAEWMRSGLPITGREARLNLMREPFRRTPPPTFDPASWKPFRGQPTDLIEDGQVIDLGARVLTALHTPGHSPGHLCFYEPKTGYLMTGDLLYAGELHASYPSTDPIAFADSVNRLLKLKEISRLLPGHHSLDIGLELLGSVAGALEDLRGRGQLRHGAGLRKYDQFSIRL